MTDLEPVLDLREVSDEHLMRRYVDGDAAAFDELFRRYERRAFAYFLRRTRCPDRAQDLYQELFLRIHRSRDDFDPHRRFAPWLFQIAHHLLIDDERRVHRARELAIPATELESAATEPGDPVAEREQLARMLEGLAADEIDLLVAAKGEGVGYAELASRLGRSVDAVKKAASRTLQRLRAAAHARQEAVVPTGHPPVRRRWDE